MNYSSDVNPLNFYGPFVPPTFESKKEQGGSSDVTEEKVQEMINDSLTDVAFVED